MLFTIHDDDLPEAQERLFQEGIQDQAQGKDMICAGFIKMAEAGALSFPELMMGQSFLLSRLVAELVSFAKDEAQALELGEKILQGAIKALPLHISEKRHKALRDFA